MSSVIYRPDRVPEQFDMDQGVPHAPSLQTDYHQSFQRFARDYIALLVEGLGFMELSSLGREGVFTPTKRLFWHRNLNSFFDFCNSAPVVPAMEPIP